MLANREIIVSVCVITYNHGAYIEQCLQSLVDQVVSFGFEIIVSDDCSTDATSEIVHEFQARYPNLIRHIRHSKNIGGMSNYFFLHSQAKGMYIAHLDGDDYALPGKLELQKKYMDENPGCNILWHRMLIENRDGGIIIEDKIDLSLVPMNGFSRSDILRYGTIGLHSSKMYRRSVREFPLPPFPVLDFVINVEQVQHGYAGFLQSPPLGVYRFGVGVSTRDGTTRRLLAQSFCYFSEKYPEYRRSIAAASLLLALASLKNRKWKNFARFLFAYLSCFDVRAIFDLIRQRQMDRMFRIPADIRRQG